MTVHFDCTILQTNKQPTTHRKKKKTTSKMIVHFDKVTIDSGQQLTQTSKQTADNSDKESEMTAQYDCTL